VPTDSAAYPAGVDFTIQVTTSSGQTATQTVHLTVQGSAPTATGIAGPGTLPEGSTGMYSLAGVGDASPIAAASLHFSFALLASGLTADYNSASTINGFAFTPANDGPYTIFARVIDKNGLFSDYQMPVTVTGVAPSAAITTAPASAFEG